MISILDVFTDPFMLAALVAGVIYPKVQKFALISRFEDGVLFLLVGAPRAVFLYFLPSFLIVFTIKLLAGTYESIPPDAFYAEVVDPVLRVNLLIVYADTVRKWGWGNRNEAWPFLYHMVFFGFFLIVFYIILAFQCLLLGSIISLFLGIPTNEREVFRLLLFSVPLMTKHQIIDWVLICTLGLIAVFIPWIILRSKRKQGGKAG